MSSSFTYIYYIQQVVIVLALFTVAHSAPKPGQEAPPPKVHTYNVPSVAKVAYPGPTVTKNVEVSIAINKFTLAKLWFLVIVIVTNIFYVP